MVPGGGVEPFENTGSAALREAMEEAGVHGILGECVGMFEVGVVGGGVGGVG